MKSDRCRQRIHINILCVYGWWMRVLWVAGKIILYTLSCTKCIQPLKKRHAFFSSVIFLLLLPFFSFIYFLSPYIYLIFFILRIFNRLPSCQVTIHLRRNPFPFFMLFLLLLLLYIFFFIFLTNWYWKPLFRIHNILRILLVDFHL